jgi:hypothetical protein
MRADMACGDPKKRKRTANALSLKISQDKSVHHGKGIVDCFIIDILIVYIIRVTF